MSLDVGVKKMVDWTKEIGPMESKKFKNIEIMKNMPPSWLRLTDIGPE